MDFSILASILVAIGVFQVINGYSEKAEEAVKNFTESKIIIPDVKIDKGGKGDASIALNSVPGLDTFWSDKLIQSVKQGHQVTTFTIPEFQARVAKFDTIINRIEEQNVIKIRDGKTKFDIAVLPVRTAIQMVSLMKKLPIENVTLDYARELVQSAIDALNPVKADIIKNNSVVIANIKAQLSQVIKNFNVFTPEDIRKKCFPNSECVANLLLDLKASIKKLQDSISLGEAVILETSFKLDKVLDIKIPEEEERIRKLAVDWATRFLKRYNIDRQVINGFYLGIIIRQNPSSSALDAIVKQALSEVGELSFYNDFGKNETKNIIYSSGYPVIDAYNTVYYLIRNKNGTVLGNEINDVNALLNQIYNETLRITPDFTAEINAFYEEINNLNASITASISEYLEKDLNETFVGDMVDYFLLFSGLIYEPIPSANLQEPRAKLEELIKRAQAKLSFIQSAFIKLRNDINARIEKLHSEVLYDIANRLYKGGKITHADIFWFGSLNLNNTFKHWKPLIAVENVNVEKTYKAIVEKNYGSYNIQESLIKIVAPVLETLARYEYVFGPALVKKRTTAVVTNLVNVPAAEYLSIVKYNTDNITELYNSKSNYLTEVSLLEADGEFFLKRGIQTYPNSLAPFVQQSHFHSLKVYGSKVVLNRIFTSLLAIRARMLASQGDIEAAGLIILERIQRIANEYVSILHKYAKLKTDGEQFIAELPGVNIVANRIIRETFGYQPDDVPDFSEYIIRSDSR